MKICLVSPYDIAQTGGVTNHIVNYANELKCLHYARTKVHPIFVPSLGAERYLIEIKVQ